MFAGDTDLSFSACSIYELQRQMEKDLKRLTIWLAANKLTLNILKTECMLVGSTQRIHSLDYSRLDLSVNGIKLRQVNDTKCLGVTIDEFLTWEPHLTSIIHPLESE